MITGELHALSAENRHLRMENLRLQSEHYKDTELVEMQRKITEKERQLNRSFPVSEDEDNAIRSWEEDHMRKEHPHSASQLKRIRMPDDCYFEYIFFPTGLGTRGICRCRCGAQFVFRNIAGGDS